MKSFFLFCIISIIAFLSCHDEGLYPDGYDHPCDYMLGRFEYLPSSLAKMAYEGQTAVFFTDTFANPLRFTVRKSFRNDKQAIERAWPDMTRTYYCYESEPVEFNLWNDSLGISIGVILMARIDGFDPIAKLVADEVSVYKNEITDSLIFFSYFKKIIDQRTFPESDYNTNYNLYTCFGKTFTDVENDPFPFNEPFIYYNDTEGVVSFRDSSGKKWCFDRFE